MLVWTFGYFNECCCRHAKPQKSTPKTTNIIKQSCGRTKTEDVDVVLSMGHPRFAVYKMTKFCLLFAFSDISPPPGLDASIDHRSATPPPRSFVKPVSVVRRPTHQFTTAPSSKFRAAATTSDSDKDEYDNATGNDNGQKSACKDDTK